MRFTSSDIQDWSHGADKTVTHKSLTNDRSRLVYDAFPGEFNKRIINSLLDAGISRPEQLSGWSSSELQDLPGIGPKAAAVIRDYLAKSSKDSSLNGHLGTSVDWGNQYDTAMKKPVVTGQQSAPLHAAGQGRKPSALPANLKDTEIG